MRHLSRDELLEAAEGLSPSPEHLEVCGACRREAEALGKLLGDLRSDVMPEPSPLFWDHFSARVASAVRRAGAAEAAAKAGVPEARTARWPRWLGWRLLVPAVSALVLVLLVLRFDGAPPPTRPIQTAVVAPAPSVATQPAVARTSDDDAWQVLTEIAAPETDADAAALADGPGLAEAAAQQLSDEEKAELVRLLQAATKPAAGQVAG